MTRRRPPGGGPKLQGTLTSEIFERVLDQEERLRVLEYTQARMVGALIFIAAEVPIVVALAALFLKHGQ